MENTSPDWHMDSLRLGAVQERLKLTQVPHVLADLATRLGQWRVALTGRLAQERLEAMWNDTVILAQYQRLFPDRYRRSEERAERAGAEWYSPREREFFDLVSQELFPIDIDGFDMYEERSLHIPTISMGFDTNDAFDYLSLGWQLAMLVCGYATPELAPSLDLDADQCQQIAAMLEQGSGRIDYDELQKICEHLDSPLRYLPVFVRIVEHDGQNTFLDPYPEQEILDDTWDTATVDALIQDWKEAEPLLDQMNLFLDWLVANPISHMQETIDLWQQVEP